MADRETLAVYAERAADYAAKFGNAPDRPLTAFMERLEPGARVLDLGCGTGNSAAALARAGFETVAWDASAEMVDIARRAHGVEAEVRAFDDLDAEHEFGGIWANFSLLHAPKAEMPAHLARIHRALKPGGIFHLGLKTGEGERRDALGRFYAYYTDAELTELLEEAGFTVKSRNFGAEEGLDGTVAPWIIVLAEARHA